MHPYFITGRRDIEDSLIGRGPQWKDKEDNPIFMKEGKPNFSKLIFY
jgi:hypothetical protein